MKTRIALLYFLLFELLLSGGCYGRDYWGDMHEGPHWMHYGYGGVFMWIIWIVIIGLIVYFIVIASRQRPEQRPPEQKQTPLDVLKMRYAKGEITKEQFEEMKRDLKE